MLIPRFTLRSTLKGLTACALVCLALERAAAGNFAAIALCVALLSVLGILCVHAVMYLMLLLVTRLVGNERQPARTSQGGIQLTPDDRYLPDANSFNSGS